MYPTRKQSSILNFIRQFTKENGYSPTYEEIGSAMSIKSPSSVHRFILALEERGFVGRSPRKSRSVFIIRMPSNNFSGLSSVSNHSVGSMPVASENQQKQNAKSSLSSHPSPSSFDEQETAYGFTDSVSSPPQRFNRHDKFAIGPSHSVTLPLYGRIAAGPTIEAVTDHSSFIEVPSSMIGQGQHYALEIKGYSMQQAAILDGDIAIIRQQDYANIGDIVVALINNQDVTLKYFHSQDDMILLKAANPNYQDITVPSENVRIQGKLTNIIRSY